MKKISPIYTYLLISLFTAVILSAAYAYFLSSLSQIKNERIAIVEEIKLGTEGVIMGGGERIREYFVPAGEEALFVSHLEEECVLYGVVCETQSLEESDPNTDLSSLQILKVTFKSVGDFSSTINFLKGLEQSKYPITIYDVNLTHGDVWESMFTISVPVVPR